MCKSNETALQMAWELLKIGKTRAIIISLIFGILFYVGFASPSIGILTNLILTILMLSFLIYVGNLFVLEDKEEIMNRFVNSSIKDILFSKIGNGVGFWLGLILVEILLLIIVAIFFAIFKIFGNFGILLGSLFVITLFFIFLYIYPALLGEVFSSTSFSDAFKKVFLIFNVNFIKSTFNSNYFFFVFVWSLVIFSLLGLMFLIIGITLLPLIEKLFVISMLSTYHGISGATLGGGFYLYILIVSILFAFMFFYFLAYSSIVAVFAKDKLTSSN